MFLCVGLWRVLVTLWMVETTVEEMAVQSRVSLRGLCL